MAPHSALALSSRPLTTRLAEHVTTHHDHWDPAKIESPVSQSWSSDLQTILPHVKHTIMQPATVSVEIVDAHCQRAQHGLGDGGMWCPHDLIHSRVVVSSSTSFCVENVFASLLGMFLLEPPQLGDWPLTASRLRACLGFDRRAQVRVDRVQVRQFYAHPASQVSTDTHQFLHQSLKIVTPDPAADADAKRNEYIANLNLTIPSNVVNRTGWVPEQCLRLPQTISVGERLRGHGNALYAQRRIDYHLLHHI